MTQTRTNMLIAELSKLSDQDLEDAVRLAKKLKADNAKASIPTEQVESFRRKHERLKTGQAISFKVHPLLTFSINVAAEHEYGCISDWSVKIEPGSAYDAAFEKVFGRMFRDYIEDWDSLVPLDPRISRAMDEESAAYKSFMRDYRAIRDQFGVDPWKLLEE